MYVVTDGKLMWLGEKEIKTGKGIVDPKNPPEWATVFEASFLDKLSKIKRGPQVVNAKDVGLLISLTGIGTGWNIAEGGAGSGYLTSWLAHIIDPGKVYSYELREDHHKIAKTNVETLGFKNVVSKNQSIFEIEEKNLDLVIFDLPDPWEGVDAAHNALKVGGYLLSYLPTTNQVRKWLIATKSFSDRRVVTSSLIDWKTDPDTFRPKSKTLAHTAFVCIGRKTKM
ncbi:MAG: methyltransferase domain-containing protein [Candidatus Altiarchaeota archaeon]|nr:methyltransferase domain-containing protein [Candidatus Altiarchaeota archaeon]